MGKFTFLGLEEDPQRAKVVFIPAPYEATTSYKSGTKEGPHRLIEASRYLEFYDEETQTEVYRLAPFLTLSEPELPVEPEKALKTLEKMVEPVLKKGLFPVLLGGEHTVTLALLRPLLKRHPNLCLLQIDAHADLRNEYQACSFSHACVMRRALELGLCDIFPVGIRALSLEEAQFIKEKGLRVYGAPEVIKAPEAVAQDILTRLGNRPLYITIDLDGLDPSEVPGVGTPEPGGLRWYDLLQILKLISKRASIVGFDVVELRPLPHDHRSEFLAARLVYKFLSYIFCRYDMSPLCRL